MTSRRGKPRFRRVRATGSRRPGYVRGSIAAQTEFAALLRALSARGGKKFRDALKGVSRTSLPRALFALDQARLEWFEELVSESMPSIKRLYTAGLKSGYLDAGIGFDPLGPDPHTLELLARSPDGIIPALRDFTEAERHYAEKVVRGSFEDQTFFDLDKVIDQVEEHLTGERWKLELIVRTETRKLAGMGKLAAWEQDPERGWFDYHYIATADRRTRPQHMDFMTAGPYTFDRVKDIWENVREPFNCRCSLARTVKPKDVLAQEGHIEADEKWRYF